jgi:hypothetical protein
MNPSNVSQFAMSRYRIVGGASFWGELIKPASQSSRPDNFDSPRRLVRVGVNANVTAGMVMVTQLGKYYLLAEHDDDETPRLALRMFYLFEVPNVVSWERMVTIQDTVTGMDREYQKLNLGTIYCAMEAPGVFKDGAFGVRSSTYRVITGSPVQLGDILNGNKKVVSMAVQLGVNFLGIE